MTIFFPVLLAVELAFSPIKVVTTTTDLAWLAREVGGDRVEVESLLTGSEDPHYVDSVPRFIHMVAKADLLCSVGLDLEVGWLPRVIERSGNRQIHAGQPGSCVVGSAIQVMGKSSGPLDRSMGDVHPQGNPHFWLSPVHMIQAGKFVSEKLTELRPSESALFRNNFENLKGRLEKVLVENRNRLEKVPQLSVMQYHEEFSYFLEAYGLTARGTIEEKPGVAPSAGRVLQAAKIAKETGVSLSLASSFNPKHVLEKFSELSGTRVLIFPTTLSKTGNRSDYIQLQRELVDQLLASIGSSRE